MADVAPSDTASDTVADDWPAQASATIVHYVGTVRDKTTGPALVASRMAVYLVAMGLIGLVALVLVTLLLVRVLVAATAYSPGVAEGESWLAYMILGALFLIGGLVMWRKKEG